jgi:hypothetical protein
VSKSGFGDMAGGGWLGRETISQDVARIAREYDIMPPLSSSCKTRMEHRHIQSGLGLSATAVDDIIDRGGRADWAFLRDASREDSSVMAKIRRVCAAHLHDPQDQKYHLWSLYAG